MHVSIGEMRILRQELNKIYDTQGNKAAVDYKTKKLKEIYTRREREKLERNEYSKKILPEVLELEKKRLAFKPIMEAILAGKPLPSGYTPGGQIPGYKAETVTPSKSAIQKDKPLPAPEEKKIHKAKKPSTLFLGIVGLVILIIVILFLILRRNK